MANEVSESQLWYVCSHEKVSGPLEFSAMVDQLHSGHISFLDFAWTRGMANWKRIASCPQLAKYLPPVPTVAVPEANVQASHDDHDFRNTELSGMDRRKVERVVLDGTIIARSFGTFEILNISVNGVSFVAENTKFEVNQDIDGVIRSRKFSSPLTYKGRIVRAFFSQERQVNCYGMLFLQMPKSDVSALHAYISLQLSIIL
jgi:hypothetical protein